VVVVVVVVGSGVVWLPGSTGTGGGAREGRKSEFPAATVFASLA